MAVTRFIASRLKFKGRMAMTCIAVSFLVMIIAVAVSSGFRTEIRDGLADISGDVQITPVDMNYLGGTSPIERHPAYMDYILAMRQVESVEPVVYRAGIVKSGENIHGVLFKGTEQRGSSGTAGRGDGVAESGGTAERGDGVAESDGTAGRKSGGAGVASDSTAGQGSSGRRSKAEQGSDSLGSLEVRIPARLASMLSLKPGDDMTSYFIGEKVRARKFKVASVYNAMVETDDKLVVYTTLEDLQRLNEWTSEQVSAFEIHLHDAFRDTKGISSAADDAGFITYEYTADDEATVVCTSAVRKYPQLFDWLNLIDFNVLFILVLMTIVAGFNMISGLLIMLFENIPTIGLLKSLGMTNRSIAGVFLTVSSSIVLKGMAIGNLLAFAFCLIQGQTHLIGLDPANYFVSFVPVHINVWSVLAADIGAYIIIMLLLLIPSLFIARVDPAKTVAVR